MRRPRIAAVGSETARALTTRDVHPSIVPPDALASQLAEALGDIAHKRILWPRAAIAPDTLAETLRARGAHVDAPIVYDTRSVLNQDTVAHAFQYPVDAVTFASGSAVRAWIETLGVGEYGRHILASTVVACIGPTTAAVARELGIDVTVIAAEHTTDGLLHALRDHFAAYPSAPVASPAL
jgi:uroporphyrinogen-III synthase